MTTQTQLRSNVEAERLADALEHQFPLGTAQNYLDGEAAAELRRLSVIEQAAKNLVKVKGRYHTEQAFNKLKELVQ